MTYRSVWQAAATRRTVLGAGLSTGLTGGSLALRHALGPDALAKPSLHAESVALSHDGRRTPVPAGKAERLVPGTRVLAEDPLRNSLFAAETAWLSQALPWTRAHDTWTPLLTAALLDLRVLSLGLPCSVAGWSKHWRYAWPRDSAHVAVALAQCGYLELAVAQLRFMQRVQGDDGWFEARYDIKTGRAPDGRARQFDGPGWLLWATAEVAKLAGAQRLSVLTELDTMVTRSCLLLSRSLDRRGLPPNTPDYWETRSRGLTLGIAAPTLSGLRHGTDSLRLLGREPLAAETQRAGDILQAAIRSRFGPEYTRHLNKRHLDASVTFLGPPYATEPPGADAARALSRATVALQRPAGGLAPGAGWHSDGISWTPTTALFAVAHAASGNREQATRLLHWLDAHRTAAGSFPEKVRHDGRPAAVAPLAWTAALTILAIAELTGVRGAPA